MKRALALVALAIGSLSCQHSNAPTPLACETHNTGTIQFSNRTIPSAQTSYDIVWDGVRIYERIIGGITTEPREETAGVAHTLTFRVSSGSRGLGCGGGMPILIRCQSKVLTCDQ